MIRRALVLTVALAVLGLTGAQQALAQACQGRPGASAIEQYCEAIPNGTGGRESSRDRGASASGGGISQATGRDLRAAGRDGAAVLALVGTGDGNGSGGGGAAKGGSDKRAGSGGSSGSPRSQDETPAAEPPSDNPLRAVKSAVSSGATVGSGFVWGLVALTLLALVVGWIGFRQRRSTS